MQRWRNGEGKEFHDIRGAGLVPQQKNGQQHQHGTEQGIKKQLEGRINTPLSAPYADDQEHRDQHAFEEDVEHHEVEGAEHADHHGLKDQEGDHIFAHPGLHCFPGRQNTNRCQQRGQQHEQYRNTVHAHVIAHAKIREPIKPFDELKLCLVLVKTEPEHEREHEGDQAGPQRGPARIGRNRLFITAHGENNRNPRQWQEGQQTEQGETDAHHLQPPNSSRETSTTSPTIMVKA